MLILIPALNNQALKILAARFFESAGNLLLDKKSSKNANCVSNGKKVSSN